MVTTIIGQTKIALTVLCILAGGFFVYAVFIWDRALPRCAAYSRLRQKINGQF
jgi:hypothetical protein